MEQIIDSIITFSLNTGKNILLAIIILIVGFKLIKMLSRFMNKHNGINKLDPGTHKFLINLISITLKILLILTAALVIGIPSASVIAVLGSAGLAVGLALQGSLSNFAGGILIIFSHPYKVGDYIEAGGVAGFVTEISVLYTTLTTYDNKNIVIPNGNISNQTIVNVTAKPNRRIDFVFSVDYSSDIDKVREVLLGVANAHQLVLHDPEVPVVYLKEQNASSLDFTLRVWSATGNYWTVLFDITEQVKKAFDANNITIPFPQLDVHLDK